MLRHVSKNKDMYGFFDTQRHQMLTFAVALKLHTHFLSCLTQQTSFVIQHTWLT